MENSMNGFSQRKKAFEAKYLHDEELNFRIKAKGNHLFGLWVAKLLGYLDEDAENYAQEVMMVELQKTQGEGILQKVLNDLEKAEVQISEHRVQKELERCREVAREMVMNEEEF